MGKMSSTQARREIGDFNKAHVDKRSLMLAYFSHISYHSLARTKRVLERDGAVNVTTFNKGGTQAFLAEFDDFAVLTFRGTEYSVWRDIWTDLQCWTKKFHGINVHYGFAKALEKVLPQVSNSLDMVRGKKIYFTGHSLGGALAQLMALEYNPECVLTFGAPRVSGGHKFEQFFNYIDFHRVVSSWDVVPHLPPRIPFWGYKHVGIPTGIRSYSKMPLKAHSMFNYMGGVSDYLKDKKHNICEH